jgi:hypothetical protein
MPITVDMERIIDEHARLLRHYGRVQKRCSRLLQEQQQAIEDRDAEIMRLRAAVIARDTALAFARDDHAALANSIPGLPRRLALVRHIDMLVHRIQALTRERARAWGQPRGAAPGTSAPALPLPALNVRRRAVLWIGQDPADGVATRHWIETSGGRFLQHDGVDDADPDVLEASLIQADLVICQTGCIGHGSYWRAQDHCRRTGKQCVEVAAPQAMQSAQTRPEGVRA